MNDFTQPSRAPLPPLDTEEVRTRDQKYERKRPVIIPWIAT